ncbi:MAG: hypothetical protein WBB35_17185, partial [Saprospiraceae bacterium]
SKATSFHSPENAYLSDTSIGESYPSYASMNITIVLKKVNMSPGSLNSVMYRTQRITSRIIELPSRLKINMYV